MGDTIQFLLQKHSSSLPEATAFDLNIIHEDDDILVLNKPKGVVVHPAPGHSSDTLVNYLIYHGKISQADENNRPGIVHRIDKDTSGLLVVAKNDFSSLHLTAQFADHSIKRNYIALVWGSMERKNGTIDKPLGRHPVNRKKNAIVDSGKRAVTHWKVIGEYPPVLSLLQCTLETGRTHQIRVHMSSINHPIVGDLVYGGRRKFSRSVPAEISELLDAFDTQALHAKTLGFYHPRTSEWVEFDSPLPQEMENLIDTLNRYY